MKVPTLAALLIAALGVVLLLLGVYLALGVAWVLVVAGLGLLGLGLFVLDVS